MPSATSCGIMTRMTSTLRTCGSGCEKWHNALGMQLRLHPWDATALAVHAATGECLEALQYVHQVEGMTDAESLSEQLDAACSAWNWETAEYLLALGAKWPPILHDLGNNQAASDQHGQAHWTFDYKTIVWALRHGFTGVVRAWPESDDEDD